MTRTGLEIQGKPADEVQILIITLCALLVTVSSIKLYRLWNSPGLLPLTTYNK